MQFHGILAAPSPPFRYDTKVSIGQPPTCTEITFKVLVALVDTMRLYGIRSPDPVALTRSLQQRETWLLKAWFCKWKCSATGDLWNLRFVQSERWPFMRSLRARFCFAYVLFATLGARVQTPTVLVGAVCDYLDSFTLPVNPVSFFLFSPLLLLETVRNLLKHCPIGPSNSSIPCWKQLTW